MAACVGMTSTLPSGNTARTSRARMASLTFSRILGRRGGKPRGFIERKNHQQARASSYDQIVTDSEGQSIFRGTRWRRPRHSTGESESPLAYLDPLLAADP